MVIRPEHDFSVPLEDWEMNVFRNAAHFTVSKRLGRMNQKTYQVNTFPEAVEIAQDDPQIMVYAVCASGRHTMLVRKRWDEYMETWDKDHGSG